MDGSPKFPGLAGSEDVFSHEKIRRAFEIFAKQKIPPKRKGKLRIYFLANFKDSGLGQDILWGYARSSNVYPEDLALVLAVDAALRAYQVEQIDDANLVFSPFSSGLLNKVPEGFADQVFGMLKDASAYAPLLIVDERDFYSRSSFPNFEFTGDVLQKVESLNTIMLSLSSSFRMLDVDIPLLPCVGFPRVLPAAKRSFSLGFSGRFGEEHWDDNHPRSAKHSTHWRKLSKLFQGKACIDREIDSSKFRSIPSQSDYLLCPRGHGIWTYRFMESIHSGAIPVLIADDYRLPYEHAIDWDSIVLRIPEDKIENMPDIIMKDQERLYSRKDALTRTQKQLCHCAWLKFLVNSIEDRRW